MTRWAAPIILLAFVLLPVCEACGPGRGVGRSRKPRKLTPLVFKEHCPNVPENILTASGVAEGRIDRYDPRFKDLVPNYNQDIIFKDEEGTGADRLMTQRCKEKLNTLAVSVMNQWPGVKLYVTEGWDEEYFHKSNSLHYEGRAVDIATSDKDRSKYGMLARLAVEAGFDWVYYESRSHIHCSVKLESASAARYGGCFPGESTVTTSNGQKKKLSDLQIGEKVLSRDQRTNKLVFSEVILFLDYDPSQKKQFLTIQLSSGRTLTVTPTHLVFVKYSRNVRTVFAENVKVNDVLLVSDSDNNIVEDNVVEINGVIRTGVYAPLTEIGTVVVNDIIVSCYATVDSQSLADWAFLPLRLVWNVERGFVRLWNVVSRPLGVWSSDFNNSVTSSRTVPVGVHWYAEILYKLADYIVPSHLRVD